MSDFQTLLLTAIASVLVGMLIERFRSREWLKKEQWKYKREIYQRLLHSVSDYASLQQRARHASKQDDTKRLESITEEVEKLLLEIDRLTGLAKVYASDETMDALIVFAKGLHVAEQKASKAATKDELRKASDVAASAANSLLRQLAETAKSDLEFH